MGVVRHALSPARLLHFARTLASGCAAGCICCDAYDIAYDAAWGAPVGGNTYRVVRQQASGVPVGQCDNEGDFEYVYDDGTVALLLTYRNPNWTINPGGGGIGNASFFGCENLPVFPPQVCCPHFDSSATNAAHPITVTCVDAGGEHSPDLQEEGI